MNTNKLRRVISMETMNTTRKNRSLQKEFKHAFRSVRMKSKEPFELRTAEITLLTTLSQESAAAFESRSCRSLFEELLDDYYLETLGESKNDSITDNYTHNDLKEDFVHYLRSLRPEPSVASSDDGITESSYDESDELHDAVSRPRPHPNKSMEGSSDSRLSPASLSAHLEGREALTDEDDWDSSSVPTIDDDEYSNKSSRSGSLYYQEIFVGKDPGFKGKGKMNHFPYGNAPSLYHSKYIQPQRPARPRIV
ncbi:hypothetical protein K493DRAFT_336628 [Basidiobolus meristosporus CBS 931.73]|uniref:Uncharacterized protein n=1 Tax=Basidiobolus meristosporus CBS 931.73 TaxID=1314790 RepID=A0A1Y1YHT8_9FUNG|nr:hypothetical protein K493DRAFT_336628 [Basidiobolus meristosporus CBS 931.73]|eukprot:ORX97276.1 hypothetical protein K493DRAFT_336628 [Basidiobolus meristosporus CBS 931.73]